MLTHLTYLQLSLRNCFPEFGVNDYYNWVVNSWGLWLKMNQKHRPSCTIKKCDSAAIHSLFVAGAVFSASLRLQ